MIYPKNFENKIGFDIIRESLISNCLFEPGKQRILAMSFSSSYDEILQDLTITNELKQLLQVKTDFPRNNYIDLTKSLKEIRLEGTYLEVETAFDLKCSLETIQSIVEYIKKLNENEYPNLKKITNEVFVHRFVLDRIDVIINKDGNIRDNASKELAEIRSKIKRKQSSVNKTMRAVLTKAQKEGVITTDVNVSVRDGKILIPVDTSQKRSIKGYVYDESATGKTSYIEPAEIIELNNSIRELEYAELREIHKILVNFTTEIRPFISDLMKAYDFLGLIDFIRSKALLSIKIKAVFPKVFNEQLIKWKDARHPILFLTHSKVGKEVVSLNIELNRERRILLISGPNAGGKSVCLKTVGLLQYMLQCGLLVPCLENSEFGVFNDILIDIGDEQSIENDLSTYSSHLLNMKYFLKNSNDKSLLLIDEFGTGTEPQIGGALAESILQKFNDNNTFGVITTHYSNLKLYAASTDGIENAAMLFDHQKIEPSYQLSIGKPGSSFAFEIARKIGLPEEILKMASDKTGVEYVTLDKHLRDIQRDKKYWENKRNRIRKSEKKLEETLDKYRIELESSKDLRKEIVSEAKKQAEEILSDVNKVIERTIREIKENNAEKEKTKNARLKIEELKQNISDEKDLIDDKIQKKIDKLKEREQVLKNKRPNLFREEDVSEKEITEINIGDKVSFIGQNTCGEVMDINNNSIMVGFGNMITTVNKEKLEKISNNLYKKTLHSKNSIAKRYNMFEKHLQYSPNIDVRGLRVDEVLPKITDFIDNAIMLNVGKLRILHGKGNGVLRNVIRDYLGTVNEVKSFKDEDLEMGGSGITVVQMI